MSIGSEEARRAGMRDWRLIGTAPRDEFRGDDFLGYIQDRDGGWFDICAWSGLHQEFMPTSCLADPATWRADCARNGNQITHWHPLRAPDDLIPAGRAALSAGEE